MDKINLIDEIKSLTNEYNGTSILWSYGVPKLKRILASIKEENTNALIEKYGCDFKTIDSVLENGLIYEDIHLKPECLSLQKIYKNEPPIFVFREENQYFEIDTKDIGKTYFIKEEK